MVIADSTCIIYLAKVGRLNLLRALYGRVLIPKSVFDETFEKGKEKGFVEVKVIEKAVKNGLLEVRELSKSQKKEARELCSFAPIGDGEAEAIVLAKDMKSELVVDDLRAMDVARVHGIETLWTTTLIRKAISKKILTKKDARSLIEKLVAAGYRISEDVLLEVLRELESF